MSTGHQRAIQQLPRIEELTQDQARREWQQNSDSWRPELSQDEQIYRCYMQDMLYRRSIGEAVV